MRHVATGTSVALCSKPATERDVSLDDARRAHANGETILDCPDCRTLVSTLAIHTPHRS